MIVTIVVALLLVGLALSIRSVLGNLDQRPRHFNASDLRDGLTLKALDLLLSAAEDEYLRDTLPAYEFYEARRKRAWLAFRYLRLINHNLSQLIRAGEAMDAVPHGKAHQMMSIALRLRLNILTAQTYLLVQSMFPAIDLSRRIKTAALRKGLLQAVGTISR